MKTDSLFYHIFQTVPEIFFTLTGFEYSASDYEFKAIEIKQTAFRLDGVFKPVANNPNLPTIFVEVQFQPDDKFYSRFFSEIFLYLHQYPQKNPCKAVVIYPERKTEVDNLHRYADLINIANINRIYLQESVSQAHDVWQLNLLELIIADVKTAPVLAKQLMATLMVQTQNSSSLLDLIETIITYKFPHLTRDEVRKMLHIPDIHLDIRKTQFYQDVFFEGKLEGEQNGELKGEIKVILSLLKRRMGELNDNVVAQIKALNLTQLDYLADNLLEFKQIDDLAAWLKQFNS
jgi:predicted transposase/invertase (TIGR01784 family)